MEKQNELDKVNTWLKASKKAGKLNTSAIVNIDHGVLTKKTQIINAWRTRPKRAKKITQKDFISLFETYQAFNSARYWLRKLRKNRADIHQGGRNSCSLTPGNLIKRSVYEKHEKLNAGGLGLEGAKKRRTKEIENFFKSELNLYPSGDLNLVVTFGNPYFFSQSEKGEKYTKNNFWRRTDLLVKITVPQNYYSTVMKSRYAVIDGMVTLSLEEPKEINGITIYRASWLKKSRGFDYKLVNGYIAIRDYYSYHGSTLASALRGLSNQLNYTKIVYIPIDTVVKIASKSNDTMTVSDSYAVHNCKSGTEHFCNVHNIDINGSLPLKTAALLLEKTQNNDLKKAMMHALKRHGVTIE